MQIVPFRAHCQSVCTNFDFSSFSRISCKIIRRLLEAKRACIGFELSENSLQASDKKGISDTVLKHCKNLYSNSEY